MTCCFQGWYHGNTEKEEEEDGRLDSASLRKKMRRRTEAERLRKEGRLGAADIASLWVRVKG